MINLLTQQQDEIQRLKQLENKAVVPRTCEDVLSLDPTSTSGYYYIDPDGSGSGDAPIYVYCDMNSSKRTFIASLNDARNHFFPFAGKTVVSHDSENITQVSSCAEPGCYSRNIVYNATLRQLVALSQLSSNCRQSLRVGYSLRKPLQTHYVNAHRATFS